MKRAEQGRGAAHGALGRLFALSEAYPDLKANQNMLVAPGGADLDREQGRVRPPGVQRRRDDLQHPARDVPDRRSSPTSSASPRRSCSKIESPQRREAPKVSFK